jgi:L-lactate dehydrogenase complex protein LldE
VWYTFVDAADIDEIVESHLKNEIEFIVGGDTSCLMHMEGILKRQGSKVQVKHIVEILNHA